MADAVLALNGTRRCLPPFPSTRDHAGAQIHILDIQTDELAEPQTRGVEQLEDGTIASTERIARRPARRRARSSPASDRCAGMRTSRFGVATRAPDRPRSAPHGADSGETCAPRRACAPPSLATDHAVEFGKKALIAWRFNCAAVSCAIWTPRLVSCVAEKLDEVALVGANRVGRCVPVQRRNSRNALRWAVMGAPSPLSERHPWRIERTSDRIPGPSLQDRPAPVSRGPAFAPAVRVADGPTAA